MFCQRQGDGGTGQGVGGQSYSGRVPASPDHDIDDPYRRGPDEARRAAVTMEDLLAVVVDRLRRTPQSGGST